MTMPIQVAFTAESVAEGHPDKLCDQLSDAVLDAILMEDKYARVACECLVTTGLVIIAGEISTKAYVDFTKLARETIRRIGYTDPAIAFDYQSCAVLVMLEEQSPELGLAVDRRGAGDQGIMVGYATDEAASCSLDTDLMPVPITLAHRLVRRLADVRTSGRLPYLYPDGKTQITVDYADDQPVRIANAVVCGHHRGNVTPAQVRDDLIQEVIHPVLGPTGLLTDTTVFHVNPAGSFSKGGPQVDVGLTGRKIAVDTYGSAARHGGSALSGKDPTKTDRSGAYMARYIAKNIVAAGLANRCEVQLSYVLGIAEPVSVSVNTSGTGRVSDEHLTRIIRTTFDLTPASIIEELDLRRPIYAPTAVYGHFGRTDLDLPWERTDRVEELRKVVGDR